MTELELEELIKASPTLYHMAERGSWSAIKEQGLLSTSALLDLYHIDGQERVTIESRHRPKCVPIKCDGQPGATIRDQIPMSDGGLQRALPTDITPAHWYQLLNQKAFFWLSRDRLLKLTNAAAYRDSEHDVLEVDTASIVHAHRNAVWLCPINSGCTKPFPHPRDYKTFKRIDDYDYAFWKTRRSSQERVVELAVDHSVPDIAAHVRRVVVMRGDEVLTTL